MPRPGGKFVSSQLSELPLLVGGNQLIPLVFLGILLRYVNQVSKRYANTSVCYLNQEKCSF